MKGKLKGRYLHKAFRVEGAKGTTYTWIKEVEAEDAECIYKANSSLQILAEVLSHPPKD